MNTNQQMGKEKVLHKELSYRLYGLCFKTHNELGQFRSEQSYGDYLEKLFKEQGVPYIREYKIPATFKGEHLGRNRVDFMIDDKIVLEIKAKRFIQATDYIQVKRYLITLNMNLGILVNFRQRYIAPRRILN